MTESGTQLTSARTAQQAQATSHDTPPAEVFAEELGRALGEAAGKRVGTALATEIHNDPATRKAAAAGVGVGIGLGVLVLLAQ